MKCLSQRQHIIVAIACVFILRNKNIFHAKVPYFSSFTNPLYVIQVGLIASQRLWPNIRNMEAYFLLNIDKVM